jgi:hypothetical protein
MWGPSIFLTSLNCRRPNQCGRSLHTSGPTPFWAHLQGVHYSLAAPLFWTKCCFFLTKCLTSVLIKSLNSIKIFSSKLYFLAIESKFKIWFICFYIIKFNFHYTTFFLITFFWYIDEMIKYYKLTHTSKKVGVRIPIIVSDITISVIFYQLN